jgi:anthranilate phosphoribosyltransferase
LDEISLATTTSVLTIGKGSISSDLLDPLDFGIARAPISALVGGDSAENASITSAIFSGERGPHRDAVVLNAAAAIAAYLGNFELSLHERMKIGIERAVIAIDSGAASTLVTKWAELSAKIGA